MSTCTATLPSFQRGVRHPGGCAQVVHEVQAELDSAVNPASTENTSDWSSDDEMTVVTLDCSNAFNAIKRAALRQRLEHHGDKMSAMSAYFSLLYGEETELRTTDGTSIMSSSGVRQGDLPASWLFADAFTAAVTSILLEAGLDEATVMRCVRLYLDDITIVGPARLCFTAARAILDQLRHPRSPRTMRVHHRRHASRPGGEPASAAGHRPYGTRPADIPCLADGICAFSWCRSNSRRRGEIGEVRRSSHRRRGEVHADGSRVVWADGHRRHQLRPRRSDAGHPAAPW